MPRVPYRNMTQSDEMAEKLDMSTAEIGLSVRTTNCLEEKGIFTVHDLLKWGRTVRQVPKGTPEVRSHEPEHRAGREPLAGARPG